MREALNEELTDIIGEGGAKREETAGQKLGMKQKDERPPRSPDTRDYFQMVFECVHTRHNFLNIITLDARNPVEPDIDLAILRALLNGKPSIHTR